MRRYLYGISGLLALFLTANLHAATIAERNAGTTTVIQDSTTNKMGIDPQFRPGGEVMGIDPQFKPVDSTQAVMGIDPQFRTGGEVMGIDPQFLKAYPGLIYMGIDPQF